MKTQFITNLEDIIKNTEEKQFLGLYKSYLNFKRSHFIEFSFLNKISIINEINELMEDEMNCRNGIEKLALEKVSETELFIKGKENIKNEWIESNKPKVESSIQSDFKRIFMYVAAFHICLLSSMILYNVLFSNKEKEVYVKPKNDYSQYEYDYSKKPKMDNKDKQTKGPISDALKRS